MPQKQHKDFHKNSNTCCLQKQLKFFFSSMHFHSTYFKIMQTSRVLPSGLEILSVGKWICECLVVKECDVMLEQYWHYATK